MTHYLFWIHGMGNHQKNWHTTGLNAFKKAYDNDLFPSLNRHTFDRRFEVVSITYDEVFRDRLNRWTEAANTLGPIAAGFNAGLIMNIVGPLRGAGKLDENFAWTHAADVILYRAFPQIRQAVMAHVANQIATTLKNAPPAAQWSIIAHSLGTAVAHDALHALVSNELGMNVRQTQATVVAMIANVSRVLQTNPKVLSDDTLVKPGKGCMFYISARHFLDVFTIPKAFNPQVWPNADKMRKGFFRNITVNHIHQSNVHDLAHYLKNPLVHVPLFKALTFKTAISREAESKAIASFKPFGILTNKRAIKIQKTLEKIDVSTADSFEKYGALWERVQETLKELDDNN